MPNKHLSTILAVPGALLIAVLVAAVTRNYINSEVDAQSKLIRQRYEEIEVLVSRRDLQPGYVIEAADLMKLAMPRKALHTDVLYPDAAPRVVGRQLIHAIGKFEPLLRVHVSKSRSGGGFSDRIAAGKRAVSLPVDIISSVNGMLRPGDRVDLLSTLRDGDTTTTVTLVANVTVMATGQRADEFNPQDAGSRYSTITLELDVEDAHRVEHAQQTGRLTVALRSPGDEQPGYDAAITDERLLRPWRSTAQRERRVEIIRGNRL